MSVQDNRKRPGASMHCAVCATFDVVAAGVIPNGALALLARRHA